jgi:predicted lipoprotein with Yx(FWY)xxD motif
MDRRLGIAGVTVIALVVLYLATPLRPFDLGRAKSAAAVTAAPAAVPTAAGNPGGSEDRPIPSRRRVLTTVIAAAVGTVIGDDRGMAVYTFSADARRRSACTKTCTGTWMPVRSLGGKPQATGTLLSASVGSILRSDGTYQITYDGQPLYYFKGDTKRGDVSGRGRKEFGGSFDVVVPGGKSKGP